MISTFHFSTKFLSACVHGFIYEKYSHSRIVFQIELEMFWLFFIYMKMYWSDSIGHYWRCYCYCCFGHLNWFLSFVSKWREREREICLDRFSFYSIHFFIQEWEPKKKLITMIILISSVKMNELNVDITYVQICLSNFKEIKQKTKK